MKFEIGPDLGYALAKGIGISLITVFLFVPCIVLLTYKWMDRTRHRDLAPGFTGLGRLVCRVIVPMAVVFTVLIVQQITSKVNTDASSCRMDTPYARFFFFNDCI